MPRIVFGLSCGLVALVSACGGEPAASPERDAQSDPSTTTAAAAIDSSDFCEIFRGFSARRQEAGAGGERYEDEAAWTQGIENVERMAAAAPDEIASEAETYVELVRARAELAASYGYEPVPADVKLQFGRDHAALQQEANELIAFAKAECSGVT
jgi:hypothetical protein